MSGENPAVIRDLNEFRNRELAAARSGHVPAESQRGGAETEAAAFAAVAVACSARLEDPRLEQLRIELLSNVLAAGRNAHHAMHTWITQLLTEYRGSRSAWDFGATSEHMQRALAQFEQTIGQAATQLRQLIPSEDLNRDDLR